MKHSIRPKNEKISVPAPERIFLHKSHKLCISQTYRIIENSVTFSIQKSLTDKIKLLKGVCSVTIFLFVLIISAVIFGGSLMNISESENPENDEEKKHSHMISAVVMLTALALIAGTFIIIPIILT